MLNYTFATLISVASLFCGLPTTAEFVKSENEAYAFRLQRPDTAEPILFGGFSQTYGNSQFIDLGRIYLSCFPGRIDRFRLNFILDTRIPDFFSNSEQLYIGLRNSLDVDGAIESRPTKKLNKLPTEFNVLAEIAAYAETVTPYDEYAVYENKKLYVTSFPDAHYFENMKKSDLVILVSYDSSSRRFQRVFEWHYVLADSLANEFLAACLTE